MRLKFPIAAHGRAESGSIAVTLRRAERSTADDR